MVPAAAAAAAAAAAVVAVAVAVAVAVPNHGLLAHPCLLAHRATQHANERASASRTDFHTEFPP